MTLKHVPVSDSTEIGTLLKMIRSIPLSGSSSQIPLSKLYLDFGINLYVHKSLTTVLRDLNVLDMVSSGSHYTYARIVSDVTTELCKQVYDALRGRTKHPLISHPFMAEITPDVLSAEAGIVLCMLIDMCSEYSPISGKWVISKSFSKRCASYGLNSVAITYLPAYLVREGALVKCGGNRVPVRDVSISVVFKALSQFHSEPAFSKMTILTFKKLDSLLRKGVPSSESAAEDVSAESVSVVSNTESIEARPEKRTAAWEVSILQAQEEQKKADAERCKAEDVLCAGDRRMQEQERDSVMLDKLRHPDKYSSLSTYVSNVRRMSRPCLAPGSPAWWFGEGMSLHYGVISSASLEPCMSGSELGSLTPHYVVVTSTSPYEEVTVGCEVYSSRDELLDAMEAKLTCLRQDDLTGCC